MGLDSEEPKLRLVEDEYMGTGWFEENLLKREEDDDGFEVSSSVIVGCEEESEEFGK